MSDEIDRQPREDGRLPDPHRLSRRRLLETGGALAAGAGLSGLIGAGTAGAASAKSASGSPFSPFKFNLKGTGQTLEGELIRAAETVSPAGKSAILSEALTNILVTNATAYQQVAFDLDFSLHWSTPGGRS